MTMTNPATTTSPPADPARGPRRGLRWRLRAVLAVLALTALLAPVLYLFTQLWSTTGRSAATTTAERAAVSYARPVNKLLAALLDAQYSAVSGTTVDSSDIRAAIDEVNTVDRRLADPLQVRQRWTLVVREIDGALGQNVNGADAPRIYAAPIALTQALLNRIAEASGATQDPGPGSVQLTEVALRSLPTVMVNAAQLHVLAAIIEAPTSRSNRSTTDPRLAVAGDRLARAASDVSTGLRAGSDPGSSYAVDLSLLGPLDQFTAAAGDLSQIADTLATPGSDARDRIEAANTLLKTKALALQEAVLNAFSTLLTQRADGNTGQQRLLVLLAVLIVLAAAGLVWLGVRVPGAPKATEPDGPADGGPDDQRLFFSRNEDAGPDSLPRISDLVNARDLFPAPVGATGLRGTQEVPGPR